MIVFHSCPQDPIDLHCAGSALATLRLTSTMPEQPQDPQVIPLFHNLSFRSSLPQGGHTTDRRREFGAPEVSAPDGERSPSESVPSYSSMDSGFAARALAGSLRRSHLSRRRNGLDPHTRQGSCFLHLSFLRKGVSNGRSGFLASFEERPKNKDVGVDDQTISKVFHGDCDPT